MAYDPDNIFAKILRGEVPCIKVYEDDHTLAFMDVNPQADGHTLIVPKTDAESIFDLDVEMSASLMRTTQKVAKAVKKALDCEGLMLAQLNGPAAGQTVFHIHFHVIPRNNDKSLGLHGRSKAETEHLETIAEKIRAALD